MPVPWRCALAAIGVLATAAVACGGAEKPSPTPTPPSAPTATAPATAVVSPSPAASPTPHPSPAATPAPSPSPAAPATLVYRGDPSRRMVALTFDAGADAGHTAEILEVLRREGVRASFSVTGLWAEQNVDLLNAIAAAGHRLVNHSYDHASFTGLSTGAPALSDDQRALELTRTETTVYRLALRSTLPYFRPPYGDVDGALLAQAGALGYGVVLMWTVDTLGWDGATADAIVERSLARAEPGAIYVMHVGSDSQDAAALPRVIAGLRAAGYAFGTVDELLAP